MIPFCAPRVAPEKLVFRPSLARISSAGLSTEKHMAKKAKKKLSKKSWSHKFTQEMVAPCNDLPLWRACVRIYDAAARFVMPVENPASRKIILDGVTLAFTNIPTNRGMLAVGDFLKNQQSHMQPCISCRLMAIGVIKQLHGDSRFAKFFKEDDSNSGAQFLVSEALMDAFALAAFEERTLDIDTESLLEHAERIFANDITNQ